MKNLKKGFTLIELLVVIAIIGILASVVLTSLSSARAKARSAAAAASLDSVRAVAQVCFADNLSLSSTAVAGSAICTGSSSKWPSLTSGWSYTTATVTSDPSAGSYSYTATGDGKTITCNQDGCSGM